MYMMIRRALLFSLCAISAARAESPYAPWTNGPRTSDDFFPIAVWVQAPSNAAKYKAIGVNTYVGLWNGPTEAQLDALEKEGMRVICHPKMAFKDRKSIIAWMHGDEPDNAQALPKGQKGYGPPILPEKIIANYERIKSEDPTRPILLNLGQGVAFDNYIGRGVRRGKLEDYPKYVQGADVVSFDIYPAVHDHPDVAGKLEYVPRGVTRLREWSNDRKLVWNCIETTRISNEKVKPTPEQVRTEVWMSLIHGSRGIIYFAHQFKPKFIEAGLLADAEMSKTVGAINAEIKALAPALNAPGETVDVSSANKDAPLAATLRHHGGNVYLFAVSMRNAPTRATFGKLTGVTKIEAIGEGRSLTAKNGQFEDDFKGYEVHLYKMSGDK
jgi:hypothetical protein